MKRPPNRIAHLALQAQVLFGVDLQGQRQLSIPTHPRSLPAAASAQTLSIVKPDPAELQARIQKESVEQAKLEGRAEGYSDGYASGHQEGLLQGEQQARKEWQMRVRQAEHLLQQLPNQIQQRLHGVEDDMLDLVFTALCRMLGQESVLRSTVRSQLLQAMQEMGERPIVAVRMHAQDIACLQAQGVESSIVFLEDERMRLGGCIIDTPAGSLDARFETQLQALRSTLLKVRAVQAVKEASC